MVKPKFTVGDLVRVVDSQTSGIPAGGIGLITGVEDVSVKHYIYWVKFGEYLHKIPMWSVEIEKIS